MSISQNPKLLHISSEKPKYFFIIKMHVSPTTHTNRLPAKPCEIIKISPHHTLPNCQPLKASPRTRQTIATRLAGVIDSLYADVSADFIETQRELIHAELFADFLAMAQHLLDEGYKDASAVIAGSSLEAHLRQLATKSGLEAQVKKGNSLVPKKADRLNSDLARANIYSILDQKNITAWLDLRNKAAHGHYDQYDNAQVDHRGSDII